MQYFAINACSEFIIIVVIIINALLVFIINALIATDDSFKFVNISTSARNNPEIGSTGDVYCFGIIIITIVIIIIIILMISLSSILRIVRIEDNVPNSYLLVH